LGCAVVIFEAVFQEMTGQGLLRGYPLKVFGRMTGPYENPIDLATYLMVLIPVLIAFVAVARGVARWLLVVLSAAAALCFGRTEALGAWMGFGASLLVIALWHPRIRRFAMLLFIGCALVGGFFLRHEGHLAAAFSASEIGKRDRWVIWQAAIRMIHDRPLLGHGVNTFMANYLDYWVGGERQPRYAHNCYLQVAAETGLTGLAAFLWLLGMWIRRMFRAVQRIDSDEQIRLLGLLAGLLAFLVHAGIDTNFYAIRQAALFWVLSGLALGMSERIEGERLEAAVPLAVMSSG
jgi:putative inorganic carbon (HCO3(-)) transporter